MATAFIEETRYIVTPVKRTPLPLGPALAQDLHGIAVTFAAIPAVIASAVTDEYLHECINNACDDLRRLLDSASPQHGHPRFMSRGEFDHLCSILSVVGYTWDSFDEGLIDRYDMLQQYAGMAYGMLRTAGAA